MSLITSKAYGEFRHLCVKLWHIKREKGREKQTQNLPCKETVFDALRAQVNRDA